MSKSRLQFCSSFEFKFQNLLIYFRRTLASKDAEIDKLSEVIQSTSVQSQVNGNGKETPSEGEQKEDFRQAYETLQAEQVNSIRDTGVFFSMRRMPCANARIVDHGRLG